MGKGEAGAPAAAAPEEAEAPEEADPAVATESLRLGSISRVSTVCRLSIDLIPLFGYMLWGREFASQGCRRSRLRLGDP